MSFYGSRIKALREATGRSQHEMAEAVGVNLPWYYDLEAFADELQTTLDLRQVHQLATALGVTLRELVAPEGRDPRSGDRTPLEEVVRRLRASTEARGLSTVEDKVGWGLTGFLEQPEVWDAPLFFLMDVCSYVQIDWFSVVPEGPPPPT
jgi:transcriptional regulator with XRE-family HTH domain